MLRGDIATRPLREVLRQADHDDLDYIPDRRGRPQMGQWVRGHREFGFGEGLAPDPVIERMRASWRDGALFDESGDSLFHMRAAIGDKEPNGRIDVAKLETLLDRDGAMDLKGLDGPTGLYGFDKDKGIRTFQKGNGLKVDGLVMPNGETIRTLKATLAPKPAQPAAQPTGGGDEDSGTDNTTVAHAVSPARSVPAPKRKPTPPPRSGTGTNDSETGKVPDLPHAVSPVPNPTMRNDKIGKGWFGAGREKTVIKPNGSKEIVRYPHKGVDIRAAPGDPIRSPVDGTVERIGDPYGDGKYQIVWIKTADGHRVGLFYVAPHDAKGNALVKRNDRVGAGQVIGTSQDRARRDPGMDNHVHIEIKKDGKTVDPSPWLEKWGKE